jgi:hypothetical protein
MVPARAVQMDKASIIADAVVYVKNLQAHARKLKEEVAALEARPRSPTGQHSGPAGAGRRRHQQQQQERRRDAGRSAGSGARVTHVGAVQVGEGRFFVTVECERRDGVAAPLCAAAESLACFRVETSSVGGRSGPDRVVSMSTLTLKVLLCLRVRLNLVNHAWIGQSFVWNVAADCAGEGTIRRCSSHRRGLGEALDDGGSCQGRLPARSDGPDLMIRSTWRSTGC